MGNSQRRLPRKIGDVIGKSWKSEQIYNTVGKASHCFYCSREWHKKMTNFFKAHLIEIYLAYNIMLVSGILHRDVTFPYIMKWSPC